MGIDAVGSKESQAMLALANGSSSIHVPHSYVPAQEGITHTRHKPRKSAEGPLFIPAWNRAGKGGTRRNKNCNTQNRRSLQTL